MYAPTLEEILTEVGLLPEWIERGRVQGKAQGIEQGKAQGIEQGKAQGIEQGQEKTARNLLARSMPIEDIAQVTELPIERIRALAAAH